MTVIVGILCEDGVIVGSDSSVTFGAGLHLRTIEQKAQKTFVVGNDLIFAGTGEVGLAQRFENILGGLRNNPQFLQANRFAISQGISTNAINNFASTSTPVNRFGALVAFACGDGTFHLCEFGLDGFQPEFKTDQMWFASMGSGQPITDPFLAMIAKTMFEEKRPRLKEGIFMAAWALDHAIEVNPGGIDGPSQLAILTRQGSEQQLTAKLLTDDDIAEDLGNVEGVKAHLRAYRDTLAGTYSEAATTTTPPPSPPAPQ